MNASPDLAALIDWYQSLSPSSLPRLAEFYSDDAYFKDPFNEFRSRHQLERTYRHMFATLQQPRFTILTRVQQGDEAFLVWNLEFRLGRKTLQLHGSSHLKFSADGRIGYHRDYWDVAEELYEKLPGLGWLMRRLKRKLQTPDEGPRRSTENAADQY